MENAAAAVSKLFTSQPAEDETTSKTSTTSNASKDTSVPRTIPDDTPSARTSDVDVDSTVDQKINPTVEHRHVKKTHETEEQTRVERERHQDHYKTTIQPIKDSEIQAEKHDHIQETKYRSANLDDGRAKAKADADLAGVKNTVDQKQFETKSTFLLRWTSMYTIIYMRLFSQYWRRVSLLLRSCDYYTLLILANRGDYAFSHAQEG